ncbi:MAG: hypothetical protein COX92_00375 [Candidatus Nealsonbacteria bacterium CG_4_10_14_0_2_um_filter_40_15]|uniref:bAvd-like domain-containing protein n=2 Tax=Candidatus Nealsoniibacteriota TaxID=1817911 RepID=A0A2M7D7Q2_9BACT|nr:MAG: hypothetical protein COS26_02050 [Candidatus Nealsonbacteria bacterium CG02_land_8_20_14_3_00_40_11]PIZ87799.1 MAG: hypothetical protein COX92_00375 [Candidatus Nealsonbacteria bacterium CG_4_10_14_0_2_um_filter_40_15]
MLSSKLYSNSWTPGLFLLPRRNSCQAENKFSREIISSKTLWKILHLTPPPDASKFNVPLVHKVCEFYKKIYSVSPRIPKRDRFGIYLKIENICLEIIDLIITASLEIKINKLLILNSARIKIEVLKRLIRIAYELGIVENRKYIDFESDLQEISKMTNGWIRYLKGF